MAIDLLNLEPTKISRDLKGKYILAYGLPKIGKTSLVASFPKSLIFSFEPGTNGLNNIYKINITSWKDFKLAVKQLANDKVKEKFDFVSVDTVDIAYDLCEQYICSTNGVQSIGDIPYGGGWTKLKKEFSKIFRDIAMMGYGIIFISHAQEKTIKENGEEYPRIVPACPSIAANIVNKLVDFIIYIGIEYSSAEDEIGTRYMYFKGNKHMQAGSRFRYIPDKVKFGYQELVDAVNDAIDKQVGSEGTVEKGDNFYQSEVRPFDEVMTEAKDIWVKILEKNDSDAVVGEMNHIIEKNFGSQVLLSQTTIAQQDALELTVSDLEDLYKTL